MSGVARSAATVELFNDDPYLKDCEAVVISVDASAKSFNVSRTVFYPLGGGQPGDTGFFRDRDDIEFNITDTRRNRQTGLVDHFVESTSHLPKVGDEVYLELDWERRFRHMRVHSCLHLLCAVVPGRVTGAQVYDGRGRVDFDTSEPYDPKQLTHSLNILVQHRAKKINLSYTKAELDLNPDLVKSLSVPVPDVEGKIKLIHFEGIDIQPCGGTHVANTEEIGQVEVTKVENKGRHNRRINIVLKD